MKKLVMAVAAVILAVTAGVAGAVDTATVNVSAVIPDTCRFNSAAAALSFGVLDPATAPAVSTSANLTFWCTNGANYSITDDDGLFETGVNANRMQSTALAVPEFIPYSMTYNPNSGTGAGPASPITLTVTGDIAAGTYSGNTADVYSDTVTLTINP